MKVLICVFVIMFLSAFNAQAQEQGDPPKMATLKEKDTIGVLDVKPEFPGGVEAFYKFVNKRFRTPRVKQDMTARIYISFIVEKDGSMSSYKILKDPGYGMADEVIRVLKLVKEKWSPGIIDGKPVRASYNLPITINIKN